MHKRVLIAVALAAATLIALLWWFATPSSVDERTTDLAQTAARTFEPSELATLRVIVVDTNGAPIGGAGVECVPLAGRAPGRTRRDRLGIGWRGATDEDGRLETVQEPGAYVLGARAHGFVASAHDAREVEVELAESSQMEARIEMRAEASISGRVTMGGVGVEGAAVFVAQKPHHGYFGVDRARTDHDGRFELTGVTPGRVYVRARSGEPPLIATTPEIALAPGEAANGVLLELAPTGAIVGELKDRVGDRVSGAVKAVGGGGVAELIVKATAADGFRIDAIAPGTVRLTAFADGFEVTYATVEVEAGAQAQAEIVLEESFGVIGHILEPHGEGPGVDPAWAVLLKGGASEAEVRATDGQFRIEMEVPFGSQIVAVAPFFESSEPTPAKPGGDVQLRMRPGGLVAGVVVTSAGAPVTDFEVGVESFDVDGPAPYRPEDFGTIGFRSSDGSFDFGPLRPGRYWLRAVAPGYAPGSAGPFDVRGSSTTDGVTIALPGGGTIRGRVTHESGRAVPRARVTVFDPYSPFAAASTKTANDGTFALTGVAPGRRSVQVKAKGFVTVVASGLEVPDGGEVFRQIGMQASSEDDVQFAFHGIGAVLEADDDGAITVRDALEGRPASLFGLKTGDRLLTVDGVQTHELRLGTVVEMIRGEEGVSVELTVERVGEGQLDLTVERGRVVVK